MGEDFGMLGMMSQGIDHSKKQKRDLGEVPYNKNIGDEISMYEQTSNYLVSRGIDSNIDYERRLRSDLLMNKYVDFMTNRDGECGKIKVVFDVLVEEGLHTTDPNATIEELVINSIEKNDIYDGAIEDYLTFYWEVLSEMEVVDSKISPKYSTLTISNSISSYDSMFSRNLNKLRSPSQVKNGKILVDEHGDIVYGEPSDREFSLDAIKFEVVYNHSLDIIWRLQGGYGVLLKEGRMENEIFSAIESCILNIRDFYFAKRWNIGDKGVDFLMKILSVDVTTHNDISIADNNRINAETLLVERKTSLTNRNYLLHLYDLTVNPFNKSTYRRNKQAEGFAKEFKDANEWLYKNDLDKFERSSSKYIKDKINAKGLVKSAYSTIDGVRPVTSKIINDGRFPKLNEEFTLGHEYWNGFQAFDIDIKECADHRTVDGKKELFNFVYTIEDVDKMKQIIHDKLKKYAWFMCVKSSTSGHGVHILTKVRPMHHIYARGVDNREIDEFWFDRNYLHKKSIIRSVLVNDCKIDEKYIHDVIDDAMKRITQGIVLNHDINALFNDNYLELPIPFKFHVPPTEGQKLEDWILHPSIIDGNLELVNSVDVDGKGVLQHANKKHVKNLISDHVNYVGRLPLLENVKMISVQDLDLFRKDISRNKARLCVMRAILRIFKDEDSSLDGQLHRISLKLLGANDYWENTNEYNGMWRNCTNNESKPIVLVGVFKLLSKHGINTKIETESVIEHGKKLRLEAISRNEHATVNFFKHRPDYTFNLDDTHGVSSRYLGFLINPLLNAFVSSKINYLESGAGTGKTSLVKTITRTCKHLSDRIKFNEDKAKAKADGFFFDEDAELEKYEKYKVLFVSPYTSILESKFINGDDNKIKDSKGVYIDVFDVYYSDGKVVHENNVATTYDKFNTQTNSIDMGKYDFIFIDESHLFPTSEFRGLMPSEVLSKIGDFALNVNSIKNNLQAMSKKVVLNDTKIVLMTGTPSGEREFYDNDVNYIRVNSSNVNGKVANFAFVENKPNYKDLEMVSHICDGLKEGKTIIVPSNNGKSWQTKMISMIKNMYKHDTDEILDDSIFEYFARPTAGTDFCKEISSNSLVFEHVRVIFCTVYLGVGVDIINEGRDFLFVIDGDKNSAEEIEQYNNRVRKGKIESTIVYTCSTAGTKTTLPVIMKHVHDSNPIIDTNINLITEKEISSDKHDAMILFNLHKKGEYASENLTTNVKRKTKFHRLTPTGVVLDEPYIKLANISKQIRLYNQGAAYTKELFRTKHGYKIRYIDSQFDEYYDAETRESFIEDSKEVVREFDKGRSKVFREIVNFYIENWSILSQRKKINYMPISSNNKEFEIFIDNNSDMYSNKPYNLNYSLEYSKEFDLVNSTLPKLLKKYGGDDKAIMEIISSIFEKNPDKLSKSTLLNRMELFKMTVSAGEGKMMVVSLDSWRIINDGFEKAKKLTIEDKNGFHSIGNSNFDKITKDICDYTRKFINTYSKQNSDYKVSWNDETLQESCKEFINTIVDVRGIKRKRFKIRSLPVLPDNCTTMEVRNEAIIKESMETVDMIEVPFEETIDIDDVGNRTSEDFDKTVPSKLITYAMNNDYPF